MKLYDVEIEHLLLGLDPPLLVGLDALPLELLESLIGACPIKDGIRLSRTCKTTLDALNNDRIWRVWARREFPALCELTDADIREKHGSWRLVSLVCRRVYAILEQMYWQASFKLGLPVWLNGLHGLVLWLFACGSIVVIALLLSFGIF